MLAPVEPEFVFKGMPVVLAKDLPSDRLFGNRHPIVVSGREVKGYVTSNGFEGGVLVVRFHSPPETVRLNEFSARAYLTCDPYLRSRFMPK